MKLISCYVENYGTISQRTYEFSDGITAFCEENGAGKTTLASFIKAMFYGLDSYRSNTKEFCDRQHFYPFAGGNFGGNLIFEWEGRTYRIERFFGEKSETADRLDVYCDGVRTDRFAADVGREIFGIDKQSFERTLFIDSAEIECATTADIGARLNRFLEGVGEDVNYDSARALLEKAAAALKKTRGSGEIAKEKARVQELDEKIRNAERTQAGLATKYEVYDALCAEIDALDSAVERARVENELLAKWEQYEYICAEAKAAKSNQERLLARYPQGLPTEEETRACAKAMEKKRECELLASATVLDSREAEELARLGITFSVGVPEEEVIADREKIANKLASLDAHICALENAQPSERERAVMVRFDGKVPGEDEIAAIKEKTQAYRVARTTWEEASQAIGGMASVPAPKKGGGYHVPVTIAACVIAVIGVALLFVNSLAGGILTALGSVALLVNAFLYLNERTGTATTPILSENSEKQRLAHAVRKAEDAARSALAAYGYTAQEGVELACYQFCEDAVTYASFAACDEERRARLALATEERAMLVAALDAFLGRYDLSNEPYSALLARLRVDRARYVVLCNKEREVAQKQAMLVKDCRALDAQIVAFSNTYGEAALDIQQTLADLAALQMLARKISEAEKKAQTYYAERGLNVKPTCATLNVEEAVERLGALRDEKSRRLRDIEQDESDADALEVYRNERQQAKERMAALEARYHMLSATMAMLDEADRALKEKYVSPVKDRFTRYSDLVERTIGERAMMSGNFEITFDVNGKQRSERHLSAGQRSICALCFRLALVENMYGGEIPFLVMDDPFLAMDETHLGRVRGVMQELANKTQILYFTCHDSRKM